MIITKSSILLYKDIYEKNFLKVIYNKNYNYIKKYIFLYFIFFDKYSLITFSDYILLKLDSKNVINYNICLKKNIEYYKKSVSLFNTNLLDENKIEYNINNINFSNDKENIETLVRFDMGTTSYNWLNELFSENIDLISSKNNLRITNLNIYFSKFPTNFIEGNTYIEDISLIKSIYLLRKKNGIKESINDVYDYNYLNYKDINKNTNFINWYKQNLSLNVNRYFNKLSIDSLDTKHKSDLIYCNLMILIPVIIKLDDKNYMNWMLRESKSLSIILYIVLFSFINLNKGGNLVIKVYETWNKSTQDLLVLLYLFFKKVKFYRPTIMSKNLNEKFIICNDFKGVPQKLIEKLLKDKKEIDKHLPDYGIDLNIKEEDRDNEFLYKKYLPPYEKTK